MLRFRKMTWAIIAWSVLCSVWAIAGASSASGTPADCAHNAYLSAKTCNDASDVGTAIGVGLIGGLWFFGFIVLSIIWFMSRPKEVLA
jgi:hypothetical protein